MTAPIPEGAGAVMAARAPASIEADDSKTALYRQLDYFPTPPWAARAGGELIHRFDSRARWIWEPACGEGHMALALAERFSVSASDIHPFGHGRVCDFLNEEDDLDAPYLPDWIVSNPPFRTAPDFIRLGLARARVGVAMLLRLQFLEGAGRHELLYGAAGLTACAVFAERVPITLGRWDPAASSATGYAWFIWVKGEGGSPLLTSVPPGTRARLTRPDDATRFGYRAPAGLLDAMDVAA